MKAQEAYAQQAQNTNAANSDVERIYHVWDEALSKNDVAAL